MDHRRHRTIFKCHYCATISVTGHISQSMVPWLVADAGLKSSPVESIVLRIGNGEVRGIPIEHTDIRSTTSTFCHRSVDIVKYYKCRSNSKCFGYQLKSGSVTVCHVFVLANESTVSDVFLALADSIGLQSSGSQTSLSCLPSPSTYQDSNFEVEYLGSMKTRERKIQGSFIDRCIDKHEQRRETRASPVTSSSHVAVLIAGSQALQLISPDRKEIIIQEPLNNIFRVVKGTKRPEQVGFLCGDENSNYACHVVTCASDDIADSVVMAMRGAFAATLLPHHDIDTASTISRNDRKSLLRKRSDSIVDDVVLHGAHICGNCPMKQFAALCDLLANEKKPLPIHEQLLTRIGALPDDQQMEILESYKENCDRLTTDVDETADVDALLLHRRNVYLMSSIWRVCMRLQAEHEKCSILAQVSRKHSAGIDVDDRTRIRLVETRHASIFDKDLNVQLSRFREFGGKAMKKISMLPNATHRRQIASTSDVDVQRARSHTFDDGLAAADDARTEQSYQRIYTRAPIGSYKTDRKNSNRRSSQIESTAFGWRQAIFSKIMQSTREAADGSRASLASLCQAADGNETRLSLTTDKKNYRQLWKKAAMQIIIDIRRSKQLQLSARDEQRLKLDYQCLQPKCDVENARNWKSLFAKSHYCGASDRGEIKIVDRQLLEDAVRNGVPSDLRHHVWRFLIRQQQLLKKRNGDLDVDVNVNRNQTVDYDALLKKLTRHQHAILIDLGRTFPTHSYYAQKFGAGQLSLFNVLKAYSLHDADVTYCQGLSFIAGILLLHMSERDAFELMNELMFGMNIRRHYLPDMLALQLEMYQLSRLIHDLHPELHAHFEHHEIPSLYAASWFLTLFASTFPVGFTARVFDCLFLVGSLDVVFRVALVLLQEHKQLLLSCHSFEEINEFLRSTLPAMGIVQMERVFNQVLSIDIGGRLRAYEAEHQMLRDEAATSQETYG